MTWLKNIIANFPQGSPLKQEDLVLEKPETANDSGDGGGGSAPTGEKTEAQKYKIPAGPPP